MHWQKWDRGKHLRLCKAKAAWPETFAASDPVLRNKKSANAKQWYTVLPTRYCFSKINLSALISSVWVLRCFYQNLIAQSLLTVLLPSLSSGHRRHQAIKRWWWNSGFRSPEKELLFVAADTISFVFFAVTGGNKGQRCQKNKEHSASTVKHTHTHTLVAEGSPGSSSIPLAVSPLRPYSIHSWLNLVPWHQVSMLAGAEFKCSKSG